MSYWNMGRLFSFVQIFLCLVAAFGYAMVKDYRRAAYFFFAACITVTVAA